MLKSVYRNLTDLIAKQDISPATNPLPKSRAHHKPDLEHKSVAMGICFSLCDDDSGDNGDYSGNNGDYSGGGGYGGGGDGNNAANQNFALESEAIEMEGAASAEASAGAVLT
jgi:hypothetical protein